MAKVMMSARLEAEVLGWAKVYAKQRDVSLAAVLEAALREFREACEGGVPELGRASGNDNQAASPAGRPSGHRKRTAYARAAGAASARVAQPSPAPTRAPAGKPPPTSYERLMRERQVRLNKGRG
jgi:hypothetical protein